MRYGRWSRVKLPQLKRPKLPRLSGHTAAVIIKVVAGAGALLIIFLLFKIQANTNLLAQQAKATADQNQRIAKVNGHHIDCLADLFAQYTRDQTPIAKADLNKCQITEAEAAGIFGPSLFTGAVDFTPTPTKSEAQGSSKTIPSQNNNTNPPTNNNQNPTPQNQTPIPTTPALPAPKPPQEILGIPLCVPFTGACVR